MRYTTLLMDADNTLLDFTRSEHDAIAETFAHFGLPNDDATIAIYSEVNDAHWKMLERGEIEKKVLMWKRFEAFCARTGLEADPKALAADYLKTLSTKSYMIEGALEVCAELAKRCRMYIITNGDKRVQQGRFDPSPLAKYFEKCYISEEVGFEKPDIRYFDAVMQDIPEFDPATTLVVGDSLTSDIKGGINAGIDTCWYNPKGKPLPAEIPVTYVINDLADLPALVEKGCL